MRVAIALALSLAFVAHAGATAMYDYKPGEFLVIDGGTSPDKKLSIVTGENKAGEFGVYLRDAQTKKLIGQLEEVATGLDSAPDAYHAHWAPDSKHVGITSRADRHWADNAIYRIENRRAYPVKTPELLCHAVPEFCQLTKELGGALTEDQIYAEDTRRQAVEGASEFELFRDRKVDFADAVCGQRGIAVAGQGTRSIGDARSVRRGEKLEDESNESAALYHVSFDAEGECELLPDDKSRVLNTQPVKEQKTKE